jgi:hypothetical protein
MLVVAAFFGGMAVQRQLDKPFTVIENNGMSWHTRIHGGYQETMTLRDGTVWNRYEEQPKRRPPDGHTFFETRTRKAVL